MSPPTVAPPGQDAMARRNAAKLRKVRTLQVLACGEARTHERPRIGAPCPSGWLNGSYYYYVLRHPIDDTGGTFHETTFGTQIGLEMISTSISKSALHSSVVAYLEQCIRFANIIQARTYLSAQHDGRVGAPLQPSR